VKFLGVAAVLGFDPSRLLRADPVEAAVLTAAAMHAREYADLRDENLATMINNARVESEKRGQRRGRH
jgi:hypothetical protein